MPIATSSSGKSARGLKLMEKVNIIWHRWGKEHGETSGLRRNDEAVIRSHLRQRLERQRALPGEASRWWRVADNLLAEIPLHENLPFNRLSDREGFIYYLPANDMCVVEDIALPPPRDEYYYYIHLGKTDYDGQLGCWIFVDWFVDILVSKDGNRFTVLDLDDVAEAFEKEIVTSSQLCEILRSAAKAIKLVEEGGLPLELMQQAKEMVQEARGRTLGGKSELFR